MHKGLCLILTHLFIYTTQPFAQGQSAYDITLKMFDESKKIHTLNYTMKKLERIDGKLISQQSTVKLNLIPFKVYLFQDAPKKGIEVLYVSGSNNNQALINPNGFPWLSINLDPMGSTMRTNQHHTLLNSGYNHVIGILEYLFDKHKTGIISMISNEGSAIWDKNNCWIIQLTNPNFKYYKYTVVQGETILSIASKYKLSEHMILEKNPSIKNYTDIKAGQVIIIPSEYSSKMILHIDKIRYIPLVMKVYDDKGLYEQYEYTNVTINGIIKSEEFLRDYKDYDF